MTRYRTTSYTLAAVVQDDRLYPHLARGTPSAQAMHQREIRVLVVDDNTDAVLMLGLLLGKMGYTVGVASNGQIALEIAGQLQPDVAFVDMVLPDIEGWDLAQELRRQPGLEKIRIFTVSGYGSYDFQRLSREAGCVAHLLKPVDPETLEKLLADATAAAAAGSMAA